MAAYMIVQSLVTDLEKLKNYQQAATPIVVRYGGRVLAIGKPEVLEGSHGGRHLVIFEFPSIEQIREFYTSKDYQEAKKLREGGMIADFLAVPGLPDDLGDQDDEDT